ncbi:hypothetical protein [Alicyclobacillus shizuokensis]|uniref:hypothetical protein n=1 Tax=Alicyclobacillus shizuokensis TaxID=392014 RepID=UPI001C3F40C1|nr:hypothetical protein [Alicyclobacillus shizuokensis]
MLTWWVVRKSSHANRAAACTASFGAACTPGGPDSRMTLDILSGNGAGFADSVDFTVPWRVDDVTFDEVDVPVDEADVAGEVVV